jgi:hypothetical protein
MARAARAWDEQHLDLAAAAGQVGSAPTGGFTEGVGGAAARFATTWERHVRDLGDEAEGHADGLRTSATDYLRTDEVAAADQQQLISLLREVR